MNAVKRMSPMRVIRIDVWGKPYNDEEQWFNIFAKGTAEEFLRRINNNEKSIPLGDATQDVDFKPYSLRWRVK